MAGRILLKSPFRSLRAGLAQSFVLIAEADLSPIRPLASRVYAASLNTWAPDAWGLLDLLCSLLADVDT